MRDGRRRAGPSWLGTAAIVAFAVVVPSSWLVHIGGGDAAASRVLFVALGVGQLVRLAFGNGGLILTAAGFELNKSEVILGEGAFRNIGEYDVLVHLHADVETTVKVVVEAEKA